MSTAGSEGPRVWKAATDSGKRRRQLHESATTDPRSLAPGSASSAAAASSSSTAPPAVAPVGSPLAHTFGRVTHELVGTAAIILPELTAASQVFAASGPHIEELPSDTDIRPHVAQRRSRSRSHHEPPLQQAGHYSSEDAMSGQTTPDGHQYKVKKLILESREKEIQLGMAAVLKRETARLDEQLGKLKDLMAMYDKHTRNLNILHRYKYPPGFQSFKLPYSTEVFEQPASVVGDYAAEFTCRFGTRVLIQAPAGATYAQIREDVHQAKLSFDTKMDVEITAVQTSRLRAATGFQQFHDRILAKESERLGRYGLMGTAVGSTNLMRGASPKLEAETYLTYVRLTERHDMQLADAAKKVEEAKASLSKTNDALKATTPLDHFNAAFENLQNPKSAGKGKGGRRGPRDFAVDHYKLFKHACTGQAITDDVIADARHPRSSPGRPGGAKNGGNQQQGGGKGTKVGGNGAGKGSGKDLTNGPKGRKGKGKGKGKNEPKGKSEPKGKGKGKGSKDEPKGKGKKGKGKGKSGKK